MGLYIALLHVSYRFLVAPYFGYFGYQYVVPSVSLVLVSVACGLLPALWMPQELKRPSQAGYWLIYLMLVVPTSIVPLFSGLSVVAALTANGLVLSAFAALGLIYLLPLGDLPSIRIPPPVFWATTIGLSAVNYGIVFLYFDLSFAFVSLVESNALRMEFYETAVHNRLIGYAVPWQSKVLNPLLFGYGLIAGLPLAAGAAIAGQLVLFAVTGQKSVLFSTLLLFAVWASLGKGGSKTGSRLVYGAVSLVGLSAIIDWLLGGYWVTSLFVRRLLLTPGLLTGYYVEFFSVNPITMLGSSFLRAFTDYPYELPVSHVIAAHYFGLPEMSANANFVADGFANFGIWGVGLWTLVLGGVLWVADSISRTRDFRLVCLVISMPAWSLVDTALFTSLMTHGLGLAVFLLIMLPSTTHIRNAARVGHSPPPFDKR